MPYYCFTRCSDEQEESIDQLAEGLGFSRTADNAHGVTWGPPAEERFTHFSGIMNFSYRRGEEEYPLQVQTVPGKNHEDPVIRRTLRRLVRLCGVEEVYEFNENGMELIRLP